jgi:bifunctional UDP-N-acetylglucosamine pyrophosphorylase/glucosamine-1-phosphate N-acetyltransferase/UDP-N-acetylglucosamine pyrophosphorylase
VSSKTSKTLAIVLAAGKGTRMKTELPKVLVQVCGRPMIDYVLDTLAAAGIDEVAVVVGHCSDLVRLALQDRPGVTFVEQAQQLGTGHAVMVCRDVIARHPGSVLVVAGDSPLMQAETIGKLLEKFDRDAPACLLGTANREQPTGLGRIVRDTSGEFLGIVEEKDATPRQKQITEVNMSCYVFNSQDLLYALDHLRAENAQREYYLTDVPGLLRKAGRKVAALPVLKPIETLSISDSSPRSLPTVTEPTR